MDTLRVLSSDTLLDEYSVPSCAKESLLFLFLPSLKRSAESEIKKCSRRTKNCRRCGFSLLCRVSIYLLLECKLIELYWNPITWLDFDCGFYKIWSYFADLQLRSSSSRWFTIFSYPQTSSTTYCSIPMEILPLTILKHLFRSLPSVDKTRD